MQDTRISRSPRDLQSDVVRLREGTERTAQRMAVLALRNWQKAASGIIALPAAAAFSAGATALFCSALVERAFEMFELGVVDAAKRLGDDFEVDGEVRHAQTSQPS
jgi:hypothetical protein